RVDSPETSADWSTARDLQLPWFKDGFARGDDLWRLSVPQTTPPLNLGDTLIDWLGGQRWVWTVRGDAQAAERIRAAVQAVQGNATLFIAENVHATGTTGRFDALKPPLDRIHRQLKAEFDPAGIFNPGRLPWFA
ncbi:MAG: glycolate oxidase subunit GlcE, partial [Burkholderiaceae bacterium]